MNSESTANGSFQCQNCGVWFVGSHTCPTVSPYSVPEFRFDTKEDLILAELREIKEILKRHVR